MIERVAPMLPEVTARMAVQALALSGVPAALSGNVIAIPGTRWHVSEACGGINYLTASLLVGYMYTGMVYRRWAHRVAFVAAAALTPIVGNLLRVYTTILLDYHGATGVASGMATPCTGLLVFTVMIAVLFVTCGRWREAVVPELPGSNRPRRDGGVPPAGRRRMPLFATIAMVLIASGPASARILWKTRELPIRFGRTSRSWAAPGLRQRTRSSRGHRPRPALSLRSRIQGWESRRPSACRVVTAPTKLPAISSAGMSRARILAGGRPPIGIDRLAGAARTSGYGRLNCALHKSRSWSGPGISSTTRRPATTTGPSCCLRGNGSSGVRKGAIVLWSSPASVPTPTP